jgi:RNA polymerase sigma-70 factor (ECF subfamily)
VAAALARIPDEQREVIVLRIFEGLSFREIAAVSGQSINTVASRYRYGIEKMRALMEGEK